MGRFDERELIQMNHILYGVIAVVILFLLVRLYPYLYFIVQCTFVFFKMDLKRKESSQPPVDVFEVCDAHVSAWFVSSKNGYIAFDTGQHIGAVNAALRQKGIDRMSVKKVFLTHSDSDHTGCLNLFPNAEVFMSNEEQAMVNGSMKRTFTKYRISFGGNKIIAAYSTLDDGQIVETDGRKIQCILTPGHTPGSMCFFVDDKYLFTGDTVSIVNGRFEQFVPLFTMDLDENRRSISKLVELLKWKSVAFVFTGHDRCTNDFSGASNGW